MNTSSAIANPSGSAGLVEALIETLRQEADEMKRLKTHFERQLEAVRTQRLDEHEQALHEAGETVGTLGRLHIQRTRKMRLLGRVLKVEGEDVTLQQLLAALGAHPELGASEAALQEARAAAQAQASQAREACEHLDFALQYAVGLGREMLQAIQALDRPPPASVYTARGDTSRAAAPSSLVNKVG